jgi:UDP-N-acetylglucosamine--N-acetylmuramyl-(pentapeptide) pyrophosphoryl-undecaprenol N-acetylglucosamine transferase
LTVAERLAAEHDEVIFVGTPNGLEARLVPQAGVAFRPLKASGFNRSRPWTFVTSVVRILFSTITAVGWLKSWKPDVVIGFGGYVSIPVGLAAIACGVPLVVAEQNSVPGLANRILSRWAHAVGVTYAESASLLAHPDRARVVGNPVRESVLKASRVAGREMMGVPEDGIMLLVFGGSRGARHINQAIVARCQEILAVQGSHVVHVSGNSEGAAVKESLAGKGCSSDARWHVLEYVDDIGPVIAGSDLVVARAGATSIAEITALGVPAVLVPYPWATDDHQTKNAATMAEHGAAVVVADDELDDVGFVDLIVQLLGDASRRANMAAASKGLGRPGAARQLVELCREAASVSGTQKE